MGIDFRYFDFNEKLRIKRKKCRKVETWVASFIALMHIKSHYEIAKLTTKNLQFCFLLPLQTYKYEKHNIIIIIVYFCKQKIPNSIATFLLFLAYA